MERIIRIIHMLLAASMFFAGIPVFAQQQQQDQQLQEDVQSEVQQEQQEGGAPGEGLPGVPEEGLPEEEKILVPGTEEEEGRSVSDLIVPVCARLVGQQVFSLPDDAEIGEVDEVFVNRQNGQISFIIVAIGGFLGLGDRQVLVTWELLQLDPQSGMLVIQVPADQLQNAPPMPAADLTGEEGIDSNFVTESYSYYGLDAQQSLGQAGQQMQQQSQQGAQEGGQQGQQGQQMQNQEQPEL
jgi:hypothetical protein